MSPASVDPVREMSSVIWGSTNRWPQSFMDIWNQEEEPMMSQENMMSTEEWPAPWFVSRSSNKFHTNKEDIRRNIDELQSKIDGIRRPTPTADFSQLGVWIPWTSRPGEIAWVNAPAISPTLQTPEFQDSARHEEKYGLTPEQMQDVWQMPMTDIEVEFLTAMAQAWLSKEEAYAKIAEERIGPERYQSYGKWVAKSTVSMVWGFAKQALWEWQPITWIPSPGRLLLPKLTQVEEGVQWSVDELPWDLKSTAWVLGQATPFALALAAWGYKAIKHKWAQPPKPKTPKKEILKLVAEKSTKKSKQIALAEGRLVQPKQTKLEKTLLGKKEAIIAPTKKIERAATVIKRDIAKPSTDPIKLSKQISSKTISKAKDLSGKLKEIPVGTMTKAKSQLKRSVKEMIDTGELTNQEVKKLKSVLPQIDKAKNLDDLWHTRIALDKNTPETVRTATVMSSDKLQKANRIWMESREPINKTIDDIAGKIWDTTVKQEFIDMNALYEANNNISSNIDILTAAKKWLLSTDNLVKAGLVSLASILWLSALRKF